MAVLLAMAALAVIALYVFGVVELTWENVLLQGIAWLGGALFIELALRGQQN